MRGRLICELLTIGLVFLPATFFAAQEPQWQETFRVEDKNLSPTGRNAYFILEPGYQLVFAGKEDGKKVQLTITALEETKRVDGVETRVVEEREINEKGLVEVSRNYFCFDASTRNIYYFGEDVDMYKEGRVVSHDGSWLCGVNGARYGVAMPGEIKVGQRYCQEVARGIAMDRAEIVSAAETVTAPAGVLRGCVKVEETTPLEPKSKEYKYYARDLGLVMDGDLKLVKHGMVSK